MDTSHLISNLILCGSGLVGDAAESRDIDSTAGFLNFGHLENNDEDTDDHNEDKDDNGGDDDGRVYDGDGDGNL